MNQIDITRAALGSVAFMAIYDSLETLSARWDVGGRLVSFKWNSWYIAYSLCLGSFLVLTAASRSPLTDDRAIPILVSSFVVIVIIMARFRFGQDGADAQRLILITLALMSFTIAPDQRYQWFAGAILLVLISDYLCAGIAKYRSEAWREGKALGQILATPYFKPPIILPGWASSIIVSKPAHRLVILFQLAAPVMLVLPWQLREPMLVCFGLFHLTNGIIMGLNDFAGIFVPCLAIAGTSSLNVLHYL